MKRNDQQAKIPAKKMGFAIAGSAVAIIGAIVLMLANVAAEIVIIVGVLTI